MFILAYELPCQVMPSITRPTAMLQLPRNVGFYPTKKEILAIYKQMKAEYA